MGLKYDDFYQGIGCGHEMKPTREELDYERKFGFLTREEVIPPDVMK
jgi:hypothetical protein